MKTKTSRRAVHQSPLRVVRDACGMTQEKFAARIGITRARVENIEMGRSSLDADLVTRIAAFAGVVPASLMDGEPLGIDLRPYNANHFNGWKSGQWRDEDANELVKRVAEQVAVVLRAAMFSQTGERRSHLLAELVVELDQVLVSQVERHRLEGTINAIYDEAAERTGGTTTVGEMRTEYGARWDVVVKQEAPALHAAPLNAVVRFIRNAKRIFTRLVAFPAINRQPGAVFGWRESKVESAYSADVLGTGIFRTTATAFDTGATIYCPPVASPSAKPTKKGEPVKARPKSRKRKG
jgi:transcriptional regulator with XRE-family HTH domain